MSFQVPRENYAVTITPNKKDKVYYAEDFSPFMGKLAENACSIVAKKFEQKKDHTLHMHLALTGPTGLYWNKVRASGWQVYVKPIYDLDGWLDYVLKTSANEYEESQLLDDHFLFHNSPFKEYQPSNSDLEEYAQWLSSTHEDPLP
jgi:hypothetical protein